jgi:hypothetical protein
MARTGGEKTKKKILEAAEKIFSAKGYDGTSIQDISKTAGVNKALIYYHFKNKQDIIDSLFALAIDEMFEMQGGTQKRTERGLHSAHAEERVGEIIAFLEKKKKILAVMLMEALKNDKTGHLSLFQCANMLISKNVTQKMHKIKQDHNRKIDRQEILMHEFFTGFVPIVFFAIFKEKWADFFKCDHQTTVSMFANIFKESHIQDY